MDNISLSFGKKIKKLRIEKGYSQDFFANKIGIDRVYYSSIENGKHSPSLEKIVDIAKGLEISLALLFEEIEKGE